MQFYRHWHFAEVNLLHLHYPKTQVTETDSCSPFCSEKLQKNTMVQRIWSTVSSFSQNFKKSRTNLFGISLNLFFLWPTSFLPFKPFEISKYLTEFIYIKLKKEKTKIQYNSSNFKEMKIILWNYMYMKISKIIFLNKSSMQIIWTKLHQHIACIYLPLPIPSYIYQIFLGSNVHLHSCNLDKKLKFLVVTLITFKKR